MAAIELADYRGVQEYLYSLKAKGVSFGIDRMRLLVEALGHPEQRYAVIHIAGTNGKGSTAAMMAAIFTQNNEPIFDSESPGATS